jgi:hypothetical protein
VLGDGGGDHRAPYDWRVVTAEGVLELLLDELAPSSDEVALSSELAPSEELLPDVVVSSESPVWFSDELVGVSD